MTARCQTAPKKEKEGESIFIVKQGRRQGKEYGGREGGSREQRPWNKKAATSKRTKANNQSCLYQIHPPARDLLVRGHAAYDRS